MNDNFQIIKIVKRKVYAMMASIAEKDEEMIVDGKLHR